MTLANLLNAVALVCFAVAALLAFDVFGAADVLTVLGWLALGLAAETTAKLAG